MRHGRRLLSATDLQMSLVIYFWGMTFFFTKLGLKSLDPLSFALLRVASAVLVLVLVAWVDTRYHGPVNMTFRDHLLAFALGFIGMACFPFCFSLAMNYTSTANAGLIFGTTPVAVALICRLTGLERLDKWQWTGLFLSFMGIVVIMAPQEIELTLQTIRGDLLMLGAMLNWALYTVINRFAPAGPSALQFTAYGALWGIIALTLLGANNLAAIPLKEIQPASWAGVLCAGLLSTALAYVVWNNTVKTAGPTKTAVYLNLVPIVAAISGFLLLNESLGWQHLLAAGLILPGVMMTRR